MGWASFNMDPEMLPLYAKRLRALGVSHWEKEEPMDVWESVKKHRPDVAEFAHEVGKATSEHHVPIADYEGQPVSPAKTMAVVIANEKNPCDPNFVNEFEEKDKDGKPTGRMLHAVGLCGVVAEHTGLTIAMLKDPFTNIKVGLDILEGKLRLVDRNIREAYYLYTGGAYWESKEQWRTKVWLNRFCSKYDLFWGIDLEAGAIDPEKEELMARIAELEKKIIDDKAGMTAARNILNQRIDA